MRSCLVVGRVFLISGQKIDVSRGCLSDRVAMLQMSNALKSTSEGRSPKVCRAMVLRSSCGVEASVSQEALQVVLSYWKISWQWCHSSNWLVSVDLGVLIRAVDVGVHDTSSESGRRTTDRPSWTPDALRLRSCLPTCVSPQPPNSHLVPCLSCCAALEPSFFPPDRPERPLIPAPALFVRHHHTAAQTHTELISSLYPNAHTQRALISTLRILEAPAATRGL